MKQIYCYDCKKLTSHIPKMDALKDGTMVCEECGRCNTYCTLLKPEDPFIPKTSIKVTWIEWNEDGTFKAQHDKPAVGLSLLMSPFNPFFTWETTPITEIIEESEGYVKFKTENSLYELYYTDEYGLKKENEDENN
jgi:hypothetical protein